MRVRWAMLPVAVVATLALTAAAAFGATVMVDQELRWESNVIRGPDELVLELRA